MPLLISLFLTTYFPIHQTSFIYCWESAFLHRIVEKRSSRHSTAVLISTHQNPICWDIIFHDLIPFGFGFPLIALRLQADNRVILKTKFGWPDWCERSWQLRCRHVGFGIEVSKEFSKRGFRLLKRIWDPRKLRRMYFVKDKIWRHASWWLGLMDKKTNSGRYPLYIQ